MGRLSWISWVGPKCNYMCPNKSAVEGDLSQYTGD